MSRKISREFHETIKKHLDKSHISLAVIARETGLSRRTLQRWAVNTMPKNYLILLKVLAFIHLSEKDANELLHLAAFPTVTEIRRTATPEDQEVMRAWPSRPVPNQSLPSPNYFIGRENLILEIKKYFLRQNGLKVCGLMGLGGAGKTTLAKRLAEAFKPDDFPDGILWGDLGQSDVESTLNQFAAEYGEDITKYSNVAAKASLVRSVLSHKRALIVLDNAENDEQLRYLLPPKASACSVLITSRKKLKTLRGWELYEVRGFNPRESLALFQYFLTKIKVLHHQAALSQMAEQLGHLPLAVLILASYLQAHPDQDIDQLPEMLKDRKARMDLLHAGEDESVRLTFELSWAGLPEIQRQYLALLSQFGGRNFSTSAVSALWEAPLQRTQKWLASFANLSLVETGPDQRWGLHPLIHDYLNEKMEAHYGEQRQHVTRRLVEHFTHSIHQSGAGGYRNLAPDLDNIIHALDNSYTYELWELLARSSPSTLNLLETFGRYESIDHLADRAIVAAESLGDEEILIALFHCLALIDSDGYMNYSRAVERANLGLEIAHDIGDWTMICEFYFILAKAAWSAGNAELERQYWLEIERVAEAQQLLDILLRLTEARAWRALWQGDYAFAEKTLTRFIQYARRTKKMKLLWHAHDYLAYVFHRKGNFHRADSHYLQALEIAVNTDGLRPVTVLLGRAQNAVAWGKLDLAKSYANEALHLTKSIARPIDILDAHIYSGDVAMACSDYAGARKLWKTALQISQESRFKIKECVTLARLGRLSTQEGDLSEAAKFLEQALQLSTHFHESTHQGYVYEQLTHLAAAQGKMDQAGAYGKMCLEIYDQMRLREAVDVRKWLHSQGIQKT